VGNFGVAGHRVGKGEPFLNIDKLRSGDAVIVETKRTWFVYRVLGRPAGASPQDNMTAVPVANADVSSVQVPGREIVDPSDGEVLLPLPDHPELTQQNAKVALMTMTTCHPKFTASQRMIVHAELAMSVPNSQALIDAGRMPARVQALYAEVNA
jgi:sortase A